MATTLTTAHGPPTALDSELIDDLAAHLPGRLLTATSPDYDRSRTVWNGMIDRHPGLIACCSNSADVAAVVRFARIHDLLISVRGGGHNIAGTAVCDGGLMLDLSSMATVEVDPRRRIARVGGGATLADFDRAAQAFGLATPLGINSTTGVAGLTLGGGFGWLSRRLGLTIDQLLSVDVVAADGTIIRANEREHPDLFWAIRGGGGNFGVVTCFEFRLHPIGPEVLAGLVIHPLASANEVLRFYRDFLPTTPEELSCWFVLRKAPPAPFVPTEWHGKEVLVLAFCWSGDLEGGPRTIAPLREFGTPLLDMVAPQPYIDWQCALDPLLSAGFRNYWKSHDFLELSDGLIDVLLQYAARLPDPNSEIAFAQLGGAVSRVAPDATAYTHRDAQFVLNVHGRWEDPANDAECVGWARSLFQAAAPFATGGAYVNFLTQEEGDRIRAVYGSNYDRLVQIKERYDPTNLFRSNQNIQPLTVT